MEKIFLLLLLGYLVGSISPGYFFGRLIKGIDIRRFGNHNTGAANVYRLVGPFYGILTAVIDFAKAPLVYSVSIPQLHPDTAILIGLAAVLGHITPFYLGFKGGRGVASLVGLFLVSLFFSRSFYVLMLGLGIIFYTLLISEQVKERFSAPWRKLLKLSSIILPLSLIWLPQKITITIVGFLLTISLTFDFLRFLLPKLNQTYLSYKRLAKQKEEKRFSGYSFFLISAFLIFLFFPKEIAVISLTNFILGDTLVVFSPAMRFLPQVKTFGNRTLAGAIVIFVVSIIGGLFLQSLSPLVLSTKTVFLGAILTAFWDQLSFAIDDNLFVPLGTATSLLVLM